MPAGDPTSVIHCPDCGGVVGATSASDAGPPCTCFGAAGEVTSARGLESPGGDNGLNHLDPSGTHVLESPQAAQKVCWKCGRDLTGHRRFKDSFGYWCIDCHKADQQEK